MSTNRLILIVEDEPDAAELIVRVFILLCRSEPPCGAVLPVAASKLIAES